MSCPPGHFSGATSRGQTTVPEVQTPSQCPDTGLSLENRAYKPLRTKHFHGISSGNQHPYLLKSRYGKVSIFGIFDIDAAYPIALLLQIRHQMMTNETASAGNENANVFGHVQQSPLF